jgi:transcriptional regulator with GAF, ATPase, and Fis domain
MYGRVRREEVEHPPDVVGADSGLQPVVKRALQVARLDAPVLILGETGSGKELIARLIHAHSGRRARPFVRVNCGAIPGTLIDSELFGHERGSFTGATRQHRGWFEQAHEGSLLLDEVGELSLEAQVRLLRVLQDGTLQRVGGGRSVRTDVRIIAATNRDLGDMVKERQFREDLWYRLAVFPIYLPPLRDRPQDIEPLVRHFAARAAARFGLPELMPGEKDCALLRSYEWPGNIRELASVVDRAVIVGQGRRLEFGLALGMPSLLPRCSPGPEKEAASQQTPGGGQESLATLDQVIRQHILLGLERSHGRVEGPFGAAKLLGLNPNTLRGKMRKLGIKPDRPRTGEAPSRPSGGLP